MLTRLKVNGFKNLVDVDIRFGPFTCIAGVNGSGKSNLFDAIRFLAALAEKPLIEAARSVRGADGDAADMRSLFNHVGDHFADEMSFEAEMIIPAEGVDDLGQPIQAGSTALKYHLVLGYRAAENSPLEPPFEIRKERLETIGADAVHEFVRFHQGIGWYESAVRADADQGRTLLSVPGPAHLSENGRPVTPPNRPDVLIPSLLPRTLLSFAAANRDPAVYGRAQTDPVTLARQEVRSWRVFQFDPVALRKVGAFMDYPQLDDNGARLASTMYYLSRGYALPGHTSEQSQAAFFASIRNRLMGLLEDVRGVVVDRDEERQSLTLRVVGRDGTVHEARTLSDGTLRFLALVVLEAQEGFGALRIGSVCIEEPENGIHPGRIPALLDLLQGIAMDTHYPIEKGNPLRQVIISTHSPSVVMRVPAESLVVVELRDTVRNGKHFNRAHFSGLANTWRDPVPSRKSLSLGKLLIYLNPEGYRPLPEPDPDRDPEAEPSVMDRPDVRDLLTPLPKLDG